VEWAGEGAGATLGTSEVAVGWAREELCVIVGTSETAEGWARVEGEAGVMLETSEALVGWSGGGDCGAAEESAKLTFSCDNGE
jgi:hypothetical protein